MEEDWTFNVPGFTLPEAAYDMLEHFCEEAGCDIPAALRIAVFHLLGSWEFEKQQEEVANDDRRSHAGDGPKAGNGHQPY